MKVRGDGIKEALERDGYAVVTDVFSADEIARMRGEATALIATEARTLAGGLINGPVPREADLARRLLKDARLASHCGGEFPCQVHIHADTLSDWHVHLPPTLTATFSGAPAWIYSIAVYLQNHPERDGLSVVPGSHKEENTAHTPLHLSTRAGDIIVFDHRIRHAGRLPNRTQRLIAAFAYVLYLLHLVDYAGQQRLFRRLRHLLQPSPASQRLAIFLLFATHHEIVQRDDRLKGPDLKRRPIVGLRAS
jgi:ectoine hydroxylase-related dioxygenase (phytanoyl-CoA dioxygenase family)